MKRRSIIMLIAVTMIAVSGCGETTLEGEEHIRESVVTPDSGTVKYEDIAGESISIGEVNTEEIKEVEQLNSENTETGYELDAKQQIQEKFRQYGDNGEITFSSNQYKSTDEFDIRGTSSDSTLQIVATVSIKDGTIEVWNDASTDGSDYIAVVGISLLQHNVSVIEQAVYNSDIVSLEPAIVKSDDGETITVMINGLQYEIDANSMTIK